MVSVAAGRQLWSVACAPEEKLFLPFRGQLVATCSFGVLSPSRAESSGFFRVSISLCCLLRQVGIMVVQRRYGRNFMIPSRFLPPKFDYHRPIPPELSEQVPHFCFWFEERDPM